MDHEKFFIVLKAGLLGPTLSAEEVDGCEKILDAMAGSPLAYTAYALATAYHETAHTMQPIKEYGGNVYFFKMYDPNSPLPNRARMARENGQLPGDGVRYCGRGYVQLTWRGNYVKADKKIGLNGALVENPDLAMRSDIAARILRFGMYEGWFTGKSFSSYLPATGTATRTQYMDARRIINGTDKSDEIEDFAQSFEKALRLAGW